MSLACPLDVIVLPARIQKHLIEYQVLKSSIPVAGLNLIGEDDVYRQVIEAVIYSKISELINQTSELDPNQKALLASYFWADIQKTNFEENYPDVWKKFSNQLSDAILPE